MEPATNIPDELKAAVQLLEANHGDLDQAVEKAARVIVGELAKNRQELDKAKRKSSGLARRLVNDQARLIEQTMGPAIAQVQSAIVEQGVTLNTLNNRALLGRDDDGRAEAPETVSAHGSEIGNGSIAGSGGPEVPTPIRTVPNETAPIGPEGTETAEKGEVTTLGTFVPVAIPDDMEPPPPLPIPVDLGPDAIVQPVQPAQVLPVQFTCKQNPGNIPGCMVNQLPNGDWFITCPNPAGLDLQAIWQMSQCGPFYPIPHAPLPIQAPLPLQQSLPAPGQTGGGPVGYGPGIPPQYLGFPPGMPAPILPPLNEPLPIPGTPTPFNPNVIPPFNLPPPPPPPPGNCCPAVKCPAPVVNVQPVIPCPAPPPPPPVNITNIIQVGDIGTKPPPPPPPPTPPASCKPDVSGLDVGRFWFDTCAKDIREKAAAYLGVPEFGGDAPTPLKAIAAARDQEQGTEFPTFIPKP